MKYRTKIFSFLLLLVSITSSLSLAIDYIYGRKIVLEGVGETALSIASTTAIYINGDEYQMLDEKMGQNSPFYKSLETKLRNVRDINRRDDVYVKYIYSLYPDRKNHSLLRYGVDAEEEGPDRSELGSLVKFKSETPANLNYQTRTVLPGFIEDVWGTWLTANAPIYNSEGKVVGSIRVDLKESDVMTKFNRLLFNTLLAFSCSILLATLMAWLLSNWFSKPLRKIQNTLKMVGEGNLDNPIPIGTKDEFGEVYQSINDMISGLKQRNHLKTTLTRYVSHQVAEKLFATQELPQISGERRKVTVLISDIRDFTPLVERLKPEDVVTILNELFEAMIEALSSNNGILDKFLGDGFMAIFGAPEDDAYQEDHAIQAAIKMQEALNKLQEKWMERFGIKLRMGIGINTGMAVVGNIGSSTRMSYTAIGDPVNLAARLESATKDLGIDVLISEYTYISATRNRFKFQNLGEISIKGRTDKVKVYGLLE